MIFASSYIILLLSFYNLYFLWFYLDIRSARYIFLFYYATEIIILYANMYFKPLLLRLKYIDFCFVLFK